jgi:hypothetical protein
MHDQCLIDPGALDEVRNEMCPMLSLPSEWRRLEDVTPRRTGSRLWPCLGSDVESGQRLDRRVNGNDATVARCIRANGHAG